MFLEAQDLPDIYEEMQELQKVQCQSNIDVKELNSRLVTTLLNVADKVVPRKVKASVINPGKSTQKKKGSRLKPKNKWFDGQCINAKRELNKIGKSYGKDPTNQCLKLQYYNKKKKYSKLVKTKKACFISQLSQDIETGKDINRKSLKKLKVAQNQGSSLDAFDMLNFCDFFKKLYGSKSLSQKRLNELKIDPGNRKVENLHHILDQDVSQDELKTAINKLKK